MGALLGPDSSSRQQQPSPFNSDLAFGHVRSSPFPLPFPVKPGQSIFTSCLQQFPASSPDTRPTWGSAWGCDGRADGSGGGAGLPGENTTCLGHTRFPKAGVPSWPPPPGPPAPAPASQHSPESPCLTAGGEGLHKGVPGKAAPSSGSLQSFPGENQEDGRRSPSLSGLLGHLGAQAGGDQPCP